MQEKPKGENFSIRLPENLSGKQVPLAAAKKGWSRNQYIKIAVGEKLVRDGLITKSDFQRMFHCQFDDVSS